MSRHGLTGGQWEPHISRRHSYPAVESCFSLANSEVAGVRYVGILAYHAGDTRVSWVETPILSERPGMGSGVPRRRDAGSHGEYL